MDAPLIASSARRHGIHDDDMLHAFNHPIFVDDLDDGFVIFVGADNAGNLLEVGVIDSADGPIMGFAPQGVRRNGDIGSIF